MAISSPKKIKIVQEKVGIKNTSSLDLALAAARTLDEQRALNVKVLDLASVSDIADLFVIASGTSEKHVQGMADKVKICLQELGESPLLTNGYDRSQWVLLDYTNIVVHIFYEPVRQYYEFDELWAKASLVNLTVDEQ